MPSYTYGLRNAYRPSAVAPKAYGWSNRPPYNRADVPIALLGPGNVFPDERMLRQQMAYEWFQSSDSAGRGFGGYGYSNPPFLSGAAGRLHPALRDSDAGGQARILRGYIRRADYEVKDDVSKCRLYFMYNPENITRDYVSYLNQTALDPFNTVFDSKNIVAPPSFMDFSFSLVFDRQEEAMQKDHPGVFVDYQYFDLVVRNVIPQNPNQTGNTLPDNGVMMVNPRDITVVFSPQLSVQGRPLNAQVNFEKFTHRMTPTRMTITLAMRVIYMGPVKEMKTYTREEQQAEDQIPSGTESGTPDFSWFTNMLASGVDVVKDFLVGLAPVGGFGFGTGFGGDGTSSGNTMVDNFAGADAANFSVRQKALDWAKLNVKSFTAYNAGSKRVNLPDSVDCSGLVTLSYVKTGNGTKCLWNKYPGTEEMLSIARRNPTIHSLVALANIPWRYQPDKPASQQGLLYGDLLIKNGHIQFFDHYGTDGKIHIFHSSPSVRGPAIWSGPGSALYYRLRPTPVAASSGAGQTPAWDARNSGTLVPQ